MISPQVFLQDLLRKLLYRDRDLCCLCLKKIETCRTDLDDEVVLLENNSQKNLKISDIFSYVFGGKIFESIRTFEDICLQCVTTTVNTYKFIKDAKDNIKHLTDAVEYIDNSLDQTSENTEGNNSLFVSLTSDLSASGHYYDNISSVIQVSDVLKKFKIYQTEKSNKTFPTVTKKYAIKEEKGKSWKDNLKNKISIAEILYDKGDPGNIRCKYCFRQFDTIPKLRTHFIRIHAPKTFQCPDCPKKYATYNLLNDHKIATHMENLVCTDCGKVFSNTSSLKQHEKTHTQLIICPECGRSYKNRNTFNKHKENNICEIMGRHSPADAKFTCDYCQKKYTQKMSLRVHIQYEHGNYKSHECKWCKKKFWCQARLQAHIVKHTKEKKFECDICKGCFVSKESLLYHTRIHTGERPYACDLCDAKFLSISRRNAHIRNQHLNPIVCNSCNINFKSIHYLMKHKKIHSMKCEKQENLSEINQEQENAVSSIQENGKENSELLNVRRNSQDFTFDVGNGQYRIEALNKDEIKPLQKHAKYIVVHESSQEACLEVSENVEVLYTD